MRTGMVMAAAVLAGLTIGPATAGQPKMDSALEHLRAARADLHDATDDKGGHKRKALALIDKAINQVQMGMRYDRKH